ncbi:MAG: hypothetical protein PF570_09640 [Candidatus Cloacimonetes bacterium]|jgi:hypothetical protein|nr:hypothetical protein [Candidatus Cloacimonadota bacterium]
MYKLNKKGVGLVMSMMIITVLLIMASGFFIVTTHMTKTTQSELEKVRLYWAAESGSNYSVNWWVSQEDTGVRIQWPYYFVPEAKDSYTYNGYNGDLELFAQVLKGNGYNNLVAFSGGMGGAGGSNQDDEPIIDDWDYNFVEGTTNGDEDPNAWIQEVPYEYHDTNGYLANMSNDYALGSLPEVCNGLTVNNEFYLHPSSERVVLNYPNSNESYTLYLLRYKGERFDAAGNAVWVMDTWAVDDKTKNTYRVLMSNMMNFTPNVPPILQYNEGIVNSMWSSGFNGRKGVYKDYDYRFGHSYFASTVRFDYKTQTGAGSGGYVGPTFWGRIHSSGADASLYGGSVGNPGVFTPGSYPYDMGLFAEGQFKTEAEAAAAVDASVLGGWEHVDDLVAEDFTWDWESVEEMATTTPTSAIYMLSPANYPVGSEITIKLRTADDAEGHTITYADISTGGSVIESIQVGQGMVEAIAVPTDYSDVSIFGVSSDYFTLFTEEDVVKVIDDLYLHELRFLRDEYEQYSASQLADPTMEMLAKLYEAMYDIYPDSQISVMSGLALTESTVEDYVGAAGGRDNQLDFTDISGFAFCTVGFYLGEGDVAVSSGNTDMSFYNIGSLIINSQGESTGSNSVDNGSSEVGFSFIQDKRFYDDDFDCGIGWGPGPDDDGVPITGLNRNYRWTGGYAGEGTITDSDFYDLMK